MLHIYKFSHVLSVYYVNIDLIIKGLKVGKLKRFVYGRISTVFFSFSDDFERILLIFRLFYRIPLYLDMNLYGARRDIHIKLKISSQQMKVKTIKMN